MTTIRCKFRCESVTKFKNHDSRDNAEIPFVFSAKFYAVTGQGGGENAQFFKWTPNGTLEVSTVVEPSFEPGKEYYLDLTPVAATAAA